MFLQRRITKQEKWVRVDEDAVWVQVGVTHATLPFLGGRSRTVEALQGPQSTRGGKSAGKGRVWVKVPVAYETYFLVEDRWAVAPDGLPFPTQKYCGGLLTLTEDERTSPQWSGSVDRKAGQARAKLAQKAQEYGLGEDEVAILEEELESFLPQSTDSVPRL